MHRPLSLISLSAILFTLLGCATITSSMVDSFDPDSYKIAGMPKSVFFSPEGRKIVAEEILNSPSFNNDTPLVTSKEEIDKYADLFGKACLETNPNESAELFLLLGMESVPVGRFKPSFSGYFDPIAKPEIYEQISLEYRPIADAMKRPDGLIPLISGVSVLREEDNNATFTDGIAIAEIQYGAEINDVCSLRIKTPDDLPLIDAFERAVKDSGRAIGNAKDTGILGFGYLIETPQKAAILLGRDSLTAPTNLTYILFK